MSKTEKKNAAADEIIETEYFPCELGESRWSVVSFEKIEAGNLTYSQAEQKLAELQTKRVSGLCIITDEAAARI